MSKRLLLDVLVNVLGDYVEGLTEENLKVGVWAGKISLSHLQLNLESLKKMNLPVNVQEGSVESVEVSIPWAHLESSPVKITIDGVYLLVSSYDIDHSSRDYLYQRQLATKRHKLQQVEKSLDLKTQVPEEGASHDPSYIQRLTAKIIDNLEITLTNIHIRYEDNTTIPGVPFAAGITLESFLVRTTNSNWEVVFVERKGHSSSTKIHKLARLSNFCLYWSTSSPLISENGNVQWLEKMKELVYTNEAPIAMDHVIEYIICPPNDLTLKLIHDEHKQAVPKVSATIESVNLGLRLKKPQYHQAMITLGAINMQERKQLIYLLKPQNRPTENPKLWWHYAYSVVCNRLARHEDKVRSCDFNDIALTFYSSYNWQ